MKNENWQRKCPKCGGIVRIKIPSGKLHGWTNCPNCGEKVLVKISEAQPFIEEKITIPKREEKIEEKVEKIESFEIEEEEKEEPSREFPLILPSMHLRAKTLKPQIAGYLLVVIFILNILTVGFMMVSPTLVVTADFLNFNHSVDIASIPESVKDTNMIFYIDGKKINQTNESDKDNGYSSKLSPGFHVLEIYIGGKKENKKLLDKVFFVPPFSIFQSAFNPNIEYSSEDKKVYVSKSSKWVENGDDKAYLGKTSVRISSNQDEYVEIRGINKKFSELESISFEHYCANGCKQGKILITIFFRGDDKGILAPINATQKTGEKGKWENVKIKKENFGEHPEKETLIMDGIEVRGKKVNNVNYIGYIDNFNLTFKNNKGETENKIFQVELKASVTNFLYKEILAKSSILVILLSIFILFLSIFVIIGAVSSLKRENISKSVAGCIFGFLSLVFIIGSVEFIIDFILALVALVLLISSRDEF